MNPFVSPAEQLAHARAIRTLEDADVPVLVGGAYAMFHYTGVSRYTKDLDLFLCRKDEARAREALDAAGYVTRNAEPLWLSKAWWGDVFVDLIHSSGNGIAKVDQLWLDNAPRGLVLGVPCRIVPPEEMIWSKAFVQERERWDGADVAHLLRACGRRMDWRRLLWRFGQHWQVLHAHLSLFAFSYPAERDSVPRWVWRKLLDLSARQRPEPERGKLCRGTLLSRKQYEVDLEMWGYRDARGEEVPGFERAELAEPERQAWFAPLDRAVREEREDDGDGQGGEADVVASLATEA
jgi:hypothetical protein